jgi:hypothetical protein
MPRLTCAADELRRVLGVHFVNFVRFAGEMAFERIVSRRWASITFSGEHHEMKLRLEGRGAAAAADAFLERIAEREFPLRGHILADIAVVGNERLSEDLVRLRLEALTVEEA